MGLSDGFRRRKWQRVEGSSPQKATDGEHPLPSITEPLYPGFVRRFGAKTKDLTDRYIPEHGPASVLQGELVRAVDKLWFEGQDNGNINWDSDFEYFCQLLQDHLLTPGLLDEKDVSMAAQSLAIIRNCGRQAYIAKPDWARRDDYSMIEAMYPGLLDTPVDVPEPRLAYVYGDLYRHLMDCVAVFAERHPDPIPYAAPAGLAR